MNRSLYHRSILEAAEAAFGAGRLDRPDATASADNPLCGDRVTIDLRVRGARVGALGHVVRGCLLCEAAASVLARDAVGKELGQLETLAESVRAMLESTAGPPGVPWQAFAMFLPVRDFKSRHQCVLLPFAALSIALESARSSD